MSEERDPTLETLFGEAREQAGQELADEDFTAGVMKRSRFLRHRLAAGWLAATALLALGVVLLIPSVQAFALLLAQALTTGVLDLGDGWLSIFASPVNSVAGVLVVVVKLVRMSRSRIRGTSYV